MGPASPQMHVVAGRVTRGSCHWRRRLGGGGADGNGQEGGKGECAGGKARLGWAEETGLTGTEVPQGCAHSGGREGDSFSRSHPPPASLGSRPLPPSPSSSTDHS